MKLTPFGFVTQTEGFLREALSLPPVGGGKWSLQRVVNFTDHAGALQVLLDHDSGPQKVKMTFHARQTGSFKDAGIQGWIEFNDGGAKDPFVLKQSNSTRAAEEIFEIVDRALTQLPEWDNSAGMSAPPPAPHSGAGFEPMMSSDSTNGTADAGDAQSMIDSIFGGNNAPEEAAADSADTPATAEAEEDAPTAEAETPKEEEAPAKKAKAPKAKKASK